MEIAGLGVWTEELFKDCRVEDFSREFYGTKFIFRFFLFFVVVRDYHQMFI